MPVSGELKVELVQMLFRHGARTCTMMEAANPMADCIDPELHETYGYQQLTKQGKAQMYKLGRTLRARYADYLGPDYRPRDLYARSTDFDRTKMSLQLVLAGLYPPSAEQAWSQELDWMPLPFSTLPRELDFLLLAFEKPRYLSLLKEARNLSRVTEKLPEFLKINENCEGKDTKAFIKSFFYGSMGIYNILNTHKAANAPLPAWYTDELFESLERRVEDFLDCMSSTREMKKLISGPLVKAFTDNMNLKGETSNPRKIYLYSGHEFNVASFLRAHGIREMRYPYFGSGVVVEKLRDSQGQLFVRMLAWTGKDDDFFTLKFDKFGEFCPIDEYLKILEDVIPSDEEVDALYKESSFDVKKINTTDFVFRPDFVP